MIHIKKEGQKLYNGLSVYSLFNKSSFGGVFRWNNYAVWCRYSKNIHRWFLGVQHLGGEI